MIEQFERLLDMLYVLESEGELSVTEICLVQIAKSLVEIARKGK